ncbi:DUF317 domain-containing protein [Streptomyces nigrescens]|uniref:DUF317 domain-containing protein n=1 Tax=Streptomyces nigrescens TaxID=1920 RepID=A0A640TUD2_STRNI|nr:DUF317 domain-containing protein [Streptomyces libani]WAU00070.1 DUF317 domain-containing protein [Streptomyces libani subsp. libani]GFE25715.1 hypothetical protein Sliba_61680 [Streptomyces libani subsp. libani]GGV98832.1 hypothetical protein GCM10010500_48430 [Streptomyces libani subsp. libani]
MTLTSTTALQPSASLPFATLGERDRLLDRHCAEPVISLLSRQGWGVVADADGNVHCSSPDQRVYVGFLPEIPAAARGELWRIVVNRPNGTAAWQQTFGDVPAQAIAGFLAALIASPSRHCACI